MEEQKEEIVEDYILNRQFRLQNQKNNSMSHFNIYHPTSKKLTFNKSYDFLKIKNIKKPRESHFNDNISILSSLEVKDYKTLYSLYVSHIINKNNQYIKELSKEKNKIPLPKIKSPFIFGGKNISKQRINNRYDSFSKNEEVKMPLVQSKQKSFLLKSQQLNKNQEIKPCILISLFF